MSQAAIVCGNSTNLFTVGENSQIQCTGVQWNANINPILPAGISIQRGVISGTPTEASPLITYTIISGRDSGTFMLGGRYL